MEKETFRIVKKSKEGVTIKLIGGNTTDVAWGEFNKNFTMSEDKLHCTPTDEFIEKQNKIEEKLNLAVMFYLRLDVLQKKDNKTSKECEEELTAALGFGNIIDELNKVFTRPQVIQLIQQRVNILRNPNIGIEPERRYRRNSYRNNTQTKPQEPAKPKGATQSLGDFEALQKLQEKFKNEK